MRDNLPGGALLFQWMWKKRRYGKCVWGGLWGGVFLCVMTSLASAHGIVGARKFVEPFVTEDANPKDEFVIAKPSFLNLAEGNALSIASLLEKRLSHDLSLSLENKWITHRRGGEKNVSGFNNLGVLLKYAWFRDEAHEFILSSGFGVELPVGDEDIGAKRDVAVESLLLYGKGFGDLPDCLSLLRPLALMGDAGFELLFHNEETHFFYNFALLYEK